LHLSFNFPPLFGPWQAKAWRREVEKAQALMLVNGHWPTWVLSNHDTPRHRTRYGSEARARAAAVMLLTLPGTPFLYMGEELGLQDAVIPKERKVDPGNRDGCRAPIPWDGSARHGWPAEPWLPFAPHGDTLHVAAQRDDSRSMLALYRKLLAARRACPALQLGALDVLEAPDGVFAYARRHDGDARVIVINYSGEDVAVLLEPHRTVEIASDGAGDGARYTGAVRPWQALVLR
jgi:alpha-glucosidase